MEDTIKCTSQFHKSFHMSITYNINIDKIGIVNSYKQLPIYVLDSYVAISFGHPPLQAGADPCLGAGVPVLLVTPNKL